MQTEKHTQEETSIGNLSGKSNVELIKEHRNELIEKLMVEGQLQHYLTERYQTKALSPVKLEFIKRSLLDLAKSNVDQVHYATLMLKIRKPEAFFIEKSEEESFHREIKSSINNYL